MEQSGETKGLVRSSCAHLESIGENYLKHMRFALTVGSLMILAGAACVIHAIIPALFTDTASRTVRRLHAVIENLPQAENLEGGEAGGLLTLTVLSLGFALLLWAMQAPFAAAIPLSVLSLGFPLAALAASARGEDEAQS